MAASDFTVAAPFLVNALLLFLSPFLGLAIQSRLRTVFSDWDATARANDPVEGAGAGLAVTVNARPWAEPRTLARATTVWIGDASQLLTSAASPLVGLLILSPHIGGAVVFLYAASFVVALSVFFAFTFMVSIDRYGYGRGRAQFFTNLVLGGILLNLLAAGAAAILQT